jgi:hypothetical protein
MMHKVEITRRSIVGGKVWQGNTIHQVDDATLRQLIEAGAVEIKMEAPAPENKARRRGRPRKVKP